MAEVLVVVEATTTFAVKKVTLELLTLARELGTPSAVVLGGPGAADALTEKLGEYGAAKIYAAESEEIDGHLVAPKATVLAELVKRVQPAAVLLGSTQEGKEIAGRLAVKLDNGILTDVVELAADGTATQIAFAGSAIVKSKVTRGLPLVTLRPNSVTPSPAPATPEVERLTVELGAADKLTRVVQRVAEQKGSRPELTEASVVVSGGRGVGNADNFKLVEEAGRPARRRGRRVPGRGRLRVLPAPVPGRTDRQDRVAAALRGARHLRCDPAPGRYADLEDHRRGEQGRRGADLRTRRLRRGRRPVQGGPAGRRGNPQAQVAPAPRPTRHGPVRSGKSYMRVAVRIRAATFGVRVDGVGAASIRAGRRNPRRTGRAAAASEPGSDYRAGRPCTPYDCG